MEAQKRETDKEERWSDRRREEKSRTIKRRRYGVMERDRRKKDGGEME